MSSYDSFMANDNGLHNAQISFLGRQEVPTSLRQVRGNDSPISWPCGGHKEPTPRVQSLVKALRSHMPQPKKQNIKKKQYCDKFSKDVLKNETTEDEMVAWHHWLNGHEFE